MLCLNWAVSCKGVPTSKARDSKPLTQTVNSGTGHLTELARFNFNIALLVEASTKLVV